MLKWKYIVTVTSGVFKGLKNGMNTISVQFYKVHVVPLQWNSNWHVNLDWQVYVIQRQRREENKEVYQRGNISPTVSSISSMHV